MLSAIFDFNGTMFFDEQLQVDSWQQFMRQKLGRSITNDEFQTYIHGRNVEVTMEYFFVKTFTPEAIYELSEEKEDIYRNMCLALPDFCLAKGLPELLDVLADHHMPINIATASAWNNVRFFFEHLNLGKWFDLQKVVYNDGTIPGKPQPDIYLKAAERLGADIHECVVFEDSLSGIEAARRAGAKKIVCLDSMQKSLAPNPAVSMTIRDYTDIEGILRLLEV